MTTVQGERLEKTTGSGRSRDAVAVVLVGLALLLPLIGYVRHVAEIGQLRDRIPTLAGLGESSTTGGWSPVADRYDSIVALHLTRPNSSERDLALEIAVALEKGGFRAEPSYPLSRPNGDGGKGWTGRDIARIEVIDQQRAIVHFTVRPETERSWFPLWVLGSTLALSASALASANRCRQQIARTLLALTLVQAALIVRALRAASATIDAYAGKFGPTEGSFEVGNEALNILRFEVSALTHALYPLGTSSILLLVPPAVLGTFLGFQGLRARVGLLTGITLAAVSVITYFEPINAAVLNILE